MQYVETILLALMGMLAMMSLILWLEKMVKIILWNYLTISVLIGLSSLIDLLSIQTAWWWAPGMQTFFLDLFHKLLSNGKPTLLLTIYFLCLTLATTKLNITVWWAKSDLQKRLLSFLFVPLTVMSILVSIAMAIFGTDLLSLTELTKLAQPFSKNVYLYTTIIWTPLWLALPGLLALLTSSLLLSPKPASAPIEA